MRQSETIADLAAALAKAQGAFANPSKDREVVVATKVGGNYTFRYATFTAVVDAVRKPLSDNGLSFVQITAADEHGHILTTRLLHASGQWLEFDTPVFVGGAGAQAFGSGLTYAKRYSLASLLGVTADMDEDGNETDGNKVDMRQLPPRSMARDPIASARREMDPRGQTPNQYQADKAAKAEKWTAAALVVVGKLATDRAIGDWWDANESAIGKLQNEHGDLYERLVTAVDERRDSVPSVLQAG